MSETEVETTVKTPEPETGDNTVVVVEPDNSSDNAETNLEIGHALGRLESRLAEHDGILATIAERLSVLSAKTENAQEIADMAVEAAVEATETAEVAEAAVEEATTEAPTEIIEPKREHWLWRKRNDWFAS